MFKKFATVCMTLMVMLPMVALSLPTAAHAEENTVSPSEGPVGTTFTFHLSGFDYNERVGIWMNVPNGTFLEINGGEGVRAGRGEIEVTWTAKPGVPLGWWQFVAEGKETKFVKTISFQVTASTATPAVGDTNVEPKIGSAGTSFNFYATGFSKGERVGYWLNSPAGYLVPIDDYNHHANDNGRVDVSWQVPAGSPTGGWQLILQGTRSGVVQAIPFIIQ